MLFPTTCTRAAGRTPRVLLIRRNSACRRRVLVYDWCSQETSHRGVPTAVMRTGERMMQRSSGYKWQMQLRRCRRLATGLVAAVAALPVLLTGGSAVASASAGPSPSSLRVGHAPTVPAGAVDRGLVAGTKPLNLVVVLKPRDPQALSAFVQAVSTPGSSQYRDFLAPGQFAGEFGATTATSAGVRGALQARGLTASAVSSDGLAFHVRGTAAAVESAFGVQIRQFRLSSGRLAYANTTAPSLPAAVAGDVQAILGLNDLARWAPMSAVPRRAPARTSSAVSPAASGPRACAAARATASYGGYTPGELAGAYGMRGLYRKGYLGAGMRVGLFELSGYTMADIRTYQACYGTSASVNNRYVDGGPTDSKGNGEVELDIEDVIGLAPKASVYVYLGPNSPQGIYDTYHAMVYRRAVQVISTSWGGCDKNAYRTGLMAAENTVFQKAAALGKTVLAASGDRGAYGCAQDSRPELDDPASQPSVTGVGGTSLKSAGPPTVETVWNNRFGAGGGGISAYWKMPSWQQGPGVVNKYSALCGTTTYCREDPDVSASADPERGYVIYDSNYGGWLIVGGTSAAAPLWGALVAIVDQRCGHSVGFLNSAIYRIAALANGSFHDIKRGNNGYYPATAHYDMASGLGSPDGGILAESLCPRPLKMTTTALAGGAVGVSYSRAVAATGGTTPYIWSIWAGTLPPGLALDSTSGVISGTPTTAGAYAFTVRAADSSSPTKHASASLSISVAKGPQSVKFTSSPPLFGKPGGTYPVSATGGGSGNPVTFTVDGSSTAGACTISGSVVSFTGAGSCVLDANQAGNANYLPAAQVQQAVTVTKTGAWVVDQAVAATTNQAGRMEIFGVGVNGAVYQKWQGRAAESWSGWHDLGGRLSPRLSAVRTPDGRLQLFAIQPGGTVEHKWQRSAGGTWSGWHGLGGHARSVAAAVMQDGRLQVFAVGPGGAVSHKWQQPGGGWSAWSSRGGDFRYVAATSDAAGRLQVFAVGPGGAVSRSWQRAAGGGWSGWHSLGGRARSVAVTQKQDGRLELFAVGPTGAVQRRWQTASGSWSAWRSLGGAVTPSMAAAWNGAGRLGIFAVGPTGSVLHRWQVKAGGSWFAWASLGGDMAH